MLHQVGLGNSLVDDIVDYAQSYTRSREQIYLGGQVPVLVRE